MYYICLFLPVNDPPAYRYLNKYVSGKVCAAGTNKWWDLGIVLIGQDAAAHIRENYPYNTEKCCSKILIKWSQRTPEASWKQLIEALKEVRLNQLASELEESLQPAEHFIEEFELQSAIVTSEKQWPLKSQELLHQFKGIIVWNNDCDECLNS